VKLIDRPAVDVVLILVAIVVGTMLLLSSVAIILIELIHPETDTSELIRMESEILGVLVGALVGVIGGRGIGRAEALDERAHGEVVSQ
jgi:hypothetical protein